MRQGGCVSPCIAIRAEGMIRGDGEGGMKRVGRHGSKRDGRDAKRGGGTIFTRA